MPKLKLLLIVCLLILLAGESGAQTYRVHYTFIDTDSTATERVGIKDQFPSRLEGSAYLYELTELLKKKGYVTASVDSMRQDSTEAFVHLYVGQKYKWTNIKTSPTDEDILSALHWPKTSFKSASLDITTINSWQEQILNYLENTGHPFARVFLDSMVLKEDEAEAQLKIDRGEIYKIDSISIFGEAKISKDFLQRYLDLPNGSIYSKKKLLEVSAKIKNISFVEEEKPSSVSLQGTGSVLNLYLKPRKSSQINALIGFLPNSNTNEDKKFLVTGEANILLRNSLGSGETIGLNWQQLQIKSPRLNLLFDQPFVFKSAVGLNFAFDMFRKDSSFVNINMQLGTSYIVGATQSALVFLQRRQSILNAVDTIQIKQAKRLPQQADVKSTNLGVTYNYNATNYRFNPYKGNEFIITGSAGTKKIRKNNQVLELKDPNFDYENLYDTMKLNSYQFRVLGYAAHYFPITKQTVLKTGVNFGFFQSGNYFLNELFQIGGYKLLRGFTEESEYVSQYIVGTAEYRYLIGVNSNFFAFIDGGWAKNPLEGSRGHTYIGTGLGMSFETKAGIFNLALALGKRDDTQLNLRQSKVHLGFVNYF